MLSDKDLFNFVRRRPEGFITQRDIDLSGDVVTLPEDLPFTLTSGGVARKTYQLQSYGEFKKIQLKVVQEGLGETVILKRATLFARPRPWRRE